MNGTHKSLSVNHLLSYLYLIAFFVIAFFSCKDAYKERPSPLRVDSASISGVDLKIIYSSPAVRNREIWGGLEPYQRVWRIGANKATVFETSDTIVISGHLVPKGRYSVFAIPDTTDWTIIFNHHWDQWGAYDYHKDQDLFRLMITPYRLDSLHERLSFDFSGESLQFRWEHLAFDLPITFPVSDQSQSGSSND